MASELGRMIKDILTENNGKSYCVGRVVLVYSLSLGMPTLCGGALYSIYANPAHPFDMQSFGIAFGAVLAGISTSIASIAMKQKTDTDGESAAPQ
jgi:hypothetical protein